MVKQLTDSEQEELKHSYREHLYDDPEVASYLPFEAGFVAGLSYNQAKLDAERQERIAFNEQVEARLDRLIAFIKGEIPRSEIEEILQ